MHCCEYFSILFAYILDGYIAYKMILSSYNNKHFLQFVTECILLLLTPKYYVIYLNNMNTHKSIINFFVVIIFVYFYKYSKNYVMLQALNMNIYRCTHLILTWLRQTLQLWKLGCGVIIHWQWSVQKRKIFFLL